MSNMSAEIYVRKIVKKVKCTRKYRKQLKQDLLGEVKAMLEQGMTMDDVISNMGSIEEAAGEFNENRSEQEIACRAGMNWLMNGLPCYEEEK
ncbi:MAG: hypothetical protein LUC90_03860 [Lachnospiraceae bacterium]|nr:hypothetical protein [Lachnospiraceae bacterium]